MISMAEDFFDQTKLSILNDITSKKNKSFIGPNSVMSKYNIYPNFTGQPTLLCKYRMDMLNLGKIEL
jgi:hypothetical protein